jgi:hypothetical protein
VTEQLVARSLLADALRKHGLFAGVIMRDDPVYPGGCTERLTTNGPLPYVLDRFQHRWQDLNDGSLYSRQ